MTQTSDVFTPAKVPTYTDVDRSEISDELRKWARRGGYFITVSGATKLGKTTMVKSFIASQQSSTSWSVYIPGQSVQGGSSDLWARLANELQIPTSRETGLASSDRRTWGVTSRISAKVLAVAEGSVSANHTTAKEKQSSSVEKFTLNAEVAVTQALSLLRKDNQGVFVALDDFHFVTDEGARRQIILALRPLTDVGCSVILSTIPGGSNDPALSGTNLSGRRKPVDVRPWTEAELAQIATKGFPAISVTATSGIVDRLTSESFGSPQIMQQLCLDLCEDVNKVTAGEAGQLLKELAAPPDWASFFRNLHDDDALEWVARLSAGPNPRKPRKRSRHPGPPASELDGYQLIMRTLHEAGAPSEMAVADIKRAIGKRLRLNGTELNSLALELKVKNMSLVASKDMKKALAGSSVSTFEGSADASDESEDEVLFSAALLAAEAIPQPVMEVAGEQQHAVVRLLDPLVAYTLKWRPDMVVLARSYLTSRA